jgi:hypothetical protein
MSYFKGLENTFCKQFDDFKAFNTHNKLIFLSFICKLTEISINMSFSFDAEKERKRGIKSVDLTKSYTTLTDAEIFSASVLEMTLMISGKRCHFLENDQHHFRKRC